MKLYTAKDDSGEWVAAERDGELIDLSAAGVAKTMLELVRAGDAAIREAERAAKTDTARRALEGATLAPPIRPGKILCSGINYKGHALENPNAKMPTEPFFFAKLPTSVVGPDDAIVHPERTGQLDYEVEFAVLIGAKLNRASEDEVMPALFGYTLLNDVSARDVQFKDNQITLGKNFDGFAPIGPCIATASALTRPDAVRLRTRLNGRTLQDGSTSDWLFPLPRLIGFLSHVMTLEPGDVVSTGTPAGVGLFQRPPVFMKPGDVVEIEAEGIGILRNRIVAR
jgi:2-keto-4-pentenoate hydratase/2-oxohepta-3-ene-1,7-dioic acid hydratase in catechol pathway